MSPELEQKRRQVLAAVLQLDAELPDSPIARLVAFRARAIFNGGGLDESTGEFTLEGGHEVVLLMAVMAEQIELVNEEQDDFGL